jgi:hypothetical protein
MSQNAISNTIKMGMRKKPAAFTEFEVAMVPHLPLKPFDKRRLKCEIYFTSHLKLQTSNLPPLVLHQSNTRHTCAQHVFAGTKIL